ncbi:MAG: phenylalanine--tRNA ligase subunit alpha, partial [Oscillospiraceae bacterium]
MKEQLNKIKETAEQLLLEAEQSAAVEELRVRFLGKKGELTAILKQMGSLSADERPAMGQLANEVRAHIETKIAERAKELGDLALQKKLELETIDVTLPGVEPQLGKRHPLQLVLDDVKEIFLGMGFELAEGPEVEYDHNNFELLNIPKGHPARDTQDTFYINDNVV